MLSTNRLRRFCVKPHTGPLATDIGDGRTLEWLTPHMFACEPPSLVIKIYCFDSV